MTPEQRRILEAAGVEVRTGPAHGLDALSGIPVRVIDGLDPDTIIVMDARAAELTLPEPAIAPDDLAWKVRIPVATVTAFRLPPLDFDPGPPSPRRRPWWRRIWDTLVGAMR